MYVFEGIDGQKTADDALAKSINEKQVVIVHHHRATEPCDLGSGLSTTHKSYAYGKVNSEC
jgi:hypothetical protein